MKNVRQYIKESILDDDEELFDQFDLEEDIIKFLDENYLIYEISGIRSRTLNGKASNWLKYNPKDGTVGFKPGLDETRFAVGLQLRSTESITNGFFTWADGEYEFRVNCINSRKLTSIDGLPENRLRSLRLNRTNISSIDKLPKSCDVIRITNCFKLTKISNIPSDIDILSLSSCSITSLPKLPEKIGLLDVNGCDDLTSLAGCPKDVDILIIRQCHNLTSLKGMPQKIAHLDMCYTGIDSLDELPKMFKPLTIKRRKELTFNDALSRGLTCYGTGVSKEEAEAFAATQGQNFKLFA